MTTSNHTHQFLVSLVPQLENKKIVLASQSPRRIELLQKTGWNFNILASSLDESQIDAQQFSSPTAYASELAFLKGWEVYTKLLENKKSASGVLPDVIISADTILAADSEIFCKPTSYDDAVTMLLKLSYVPEHSVITAVCILFPHYLPNVSAPVSSSSSSSLLKNGCIRFEESTTVLLNPLTEDQAKAYVDVGESMDKAGAYAYQSVASLFVKEIRGSYYNVVGFPISRIVQELNHYYQQEK